jgi:hypothetical protein
VFTALNASRFLSVVFHTDLCQPAVSTCPLLSLIRINSCELYHGILERNMRDWAGEWGTCVTVLGSWGGLFHGTHFPSLGSTQVTTVHKDMTYSDMFCEILWNQSNKWSHQHPWHHAFQAHTGFAAKVACTVYHNTRCNWLVIPLLPELWRKIQNGGQVAPVQWKSEKFPCRYQELQIYAWNL